MNAKDTRTPQERAMHAAVAAEMVEFERRMDLLKAQAAKFIGDCRKCNYGHQGSMAHVNELLAQALGGMGNREFTEE